MVFYLSLSNSFVFANDCKNSIQKILLSLQSQDLDEVVVSYAKMKSDQLLKLKGKEPREKLMTSHADRQDIIFVYGVPQKLESVDHQGKITFRHYTSDALDSILNSNSLKAGPRPFIDPTPHARWEYQDLNGIMFTTPKFETRELWMNITDQSDWVEFTLDPKVPVLLCKEGNYLIPLQRNYPDWIRKDYENYLQTGKSMHRMEEEFYKIKESGGMVDAQRIHIRISSYQKNGVLYQLKLK